MQVKNGFFRKPDIDGVKDIWLPLGDTSRRVRVLRITLDSGEIETLVINLSEAEMEYEAFCELSVRRTVQQALGYRDRNI